MHEKNIKRIIRKQVKSSYPNWKNLPKKNKKAIAKKITDAAIKGYDYDTNLDLPIEELIGTENQIPTAGIMNLEEMANFIDKFYRGSIFNFDRHRKTWPEIVSEELKVIDKLLDNRIINRLLSYEGYSPCMRDIFPCQFFRAELLKALKYPEISYRKFCTEEYMGQERKENRRFLGLPLHTKDMIDHTQLCQFRRDLSFKQMSNLLVYILHHFFQSGLLENCVVHGVDSTEIANDNRLPLYSVKLGGKKIRIYTDIDCDCGPRRNKRDKSPYVIGYRMHTLTAINPSTGHSFPLVSLLGPANHHDSLFLRPLIALAQAMGIEMKLITADEAYHDKDGSLLRDSGVHLITPVSSGKNVLANVDPETLTVTCDDYCETPMIRLGITDEGHEYKCNASGGECSRACQCSQFRIIPFDNGHFQRMPIDNELSEQAIDIRKNCERPFNLLKKREGLEDARVRSQHALTARCTFGMIATLLIEIAGKRRKKKPDHRQLKLFDKAA